MADKFLVEKRQSFLTYVASKTLVFAKNTDLLYDRLDDFFGKAKEAFTKLSKDIKHAEPEELFMGGNEFREQLSGFTVLSQDAHKDAPNLVEFHSKPQPSFNKKFDLLMTFLKK